MEVVLFSLKITTSPTLEVGVVSVDALGLRKARSLFFLWLFELHDLL